MGKEAVPSTQQVGQPLCPQGKSTDDTIGRRRSVSLSPRPARNQYSVRVRYRTPPHRTKYSFQIHDRTPPPPHRFSNGTKVDFLAKIMERRALKKALAEPAETRQEVVMINPHSRSEIVEDSKVDSAKQCDQYTSDNMKPMTLPSRIGDAASCAEPNESQKILRDSFLEPAETRHEVNMINPHSRSETEKDSKVDSAKQCVQYTSDNVKPKALPSRIGDAASCAEPNESQKYPRDELLRHSQVCGSVSSSSVVRFPTDLAADSTTRRDVPFTPVEKPANNASMNVPDAISSLQSSASPSSTDATRPEIDVWDLTGWFKWAEINVILDSMKESNRDKGKRVNFFSSLKMLLERGCEIEEIKESIMDRLSNGSGAIRRSALRMFKGYTFESDKSYYLPEEFGEKAPGMKRGPRRPGTSVDVPTSIVKSPKGDLIADSKSEAIRAKPLEKKRVAFDPNASILSEVSWIDPDCNYILTTAKHQTGVNVTNARGDSLLHCAVFKGNKHLVKLLLENGADANSLDDDLWSPLHLAAILPNDKKSKEDRDNQLEIVQLLLLHGANPFLRCRPVSSTDVKRGYTVSEVYNTQKNNDMVEAAISLVKSRIIRSRFGRDKLFLIISYRLVHSILEKGQIVRVLGSRPEEERVLCEWISSGTNSSQRGWIPACFLSPVPPRVATSCKNETNKNFSDLYRKHEKGQRVQALILAGHKDLKDIHANAMIFNPSEDDIVEKDMISEEYAFDTNECLFLDRLQILVNLPSLAKLDIKSIRFLRLISNVTEFLQGTSEENEDEDPSSTEYESVVGSADTTVSAGRRSENDTTMGTEEQHTKAPGNPFMVNRSGYPFLNKTARKLSFNSTGTSSCDLQGMNETCALNTSQVSASHRGISSSNRSVGRNSEVISHSDGTPHGSEDDNSPIAE